MRLMASLNWPSSSRRRRDKPGFKFAFGNRSGSGRELGNGARQTSNQGQPAGGGNQNDHEGRRQPGRVVEEKRIRPQRRERPHQRGIISPHRGSIEDGNVNAYPIASGWAGPDQEHGKSRARWVAGRKLPITTGHDCREALPICCARSDLGLPSVSDNHRLEQPAPPERRALRLPNAFRVTLARSFPERTRSSRVGADPVCGMGLGGPTRRGP